MDINIFHRTDNGNPESWSEHLFIFSVNSFLNRSFVKSILFFIFFLPKVWYIKNWFVFICVIWSPNICLFDCIDVRAMKTKMLIYILKIVFEHWDICDSKTQICSVFQHPTHRTPNTSQHWLFWDRKLSETSVASLILCSYFEWKAKEKEKEKQPTEMDGKRRKMCINTLDELTKRKFTRKSFRTKLE